MKGQEGGREGRNEKKRRGGEGQDEEEMREGRCEKGERA